MAEIDPIVWLVGLWHLYKFLKIMAKFPAYVGCIAEQIHTEQCKGFGQVGKKCCGVRNFHI